MCIHIGGNPGMPHNRGGSGADLKDKRQFATQRSKVGGRGEEVGRNGRKNHILKDIRGSRGWYI